ncbi:gamma-glutamyl-gamma-aminobutyrate hydrolase family protein [Pedobacter changchengzhani]|uniref:Gamma-glutamyl-gamma-aminobutyrate hydrolase family protein n=1 Tax=Pedobacter changchengzhani TaxID=2529274 RepID=A0A4R5MI09_9SPHI|nr:gamma-glutamyl-gamma-aminobutyrate hydrolase family protein [Pedobacter changchengzhani]TDG35174.1 gamma-glutamyl-gamma-aminobutyrate hydrolase family protein [Pedobacter changchengzhani]
MGKIIIGVTDCSKFETYRNWILTANKNIEIIKIGHQHDNFNEIEKCHGILLTGGEDVHPKFYNMEEYYPYCYEDDIDEKRDEFEFKILAYTEKNAIPILGICRGMQVANVFFGGTLIPDLTTWGKFNHGKMLDNADRYHEIQIDPSSWLNTILGVDIGFTNSNHHQSLAKIGKGFVVSALSKDGVAEALERFNPDQKSFALYVQWHPERMKDQNSPLSMKVLNAFIGAMMVNMTS